MPNQRTVLLRFMWLTPAVLALSMMHGACNHCNPAGPSGSITAAAGTLAPGEQRLVVVQTPDGTSEVRLTGTFENLTIWTIDPDCSLPIEQCRTAGGTRDGDRLTFGSARGHNYNDFAATARFVVMNPSPDRTVDYQLTFTPWRPGCT